MIKNVISEYVNEFAKNTVYLGKTFLNQDGSFADGDEEFYHFIGKNSCYTFLELVHPDDVAEVTEAMKNLDGGAQHIIGRVKGNDDEYSFLYFVVSKSERVIDGFHPIEIEFGSFISLREKYTQYASNLKKYRMYLSFIPYFFYEYDYDSDILTIYQYVNQKSSILFKERMKECQQRILADPQLTDTERVEFFKFYDKLATNTQRCHIQISAKAFGIQGVKGTFVFKGALMHLGNDKGKNVGIIESTSAEEKEERYYLSENAFDPGTGILNKRAINEYAVDKLQECQIKNASMYLVVMDIDDFKTINDTHGHMFGDEVLARIAEILRTVLDNRGFCGRFGGDEFMLVLDSVETEAELREILKTMNKNMYYAFDERDVHITTSCGISQFPKDGTSLEELFVIADKAVYIAKKKGKNRYIIYDEAKHGAIENEDAEVRNAGIHALADVNKKSAVMTDLMLKLYRMGKRSIPYAMEVVRDYFDIDGVAIYYGDELKRAYASGSYVEPIQKLDCILGTTYCELFGERGVYMESIISKLKTFYPEVFELFIKQENGKFIQFMARKYGKPTVIVSFDYFNRSPKIGSSDLSFITMIGRLMAEILVTD